MNIFNRVVVTLLLLGLIAVAIFGIVSPQYTIGLVREQALAAESVLIDANRLTDLVVVGASVLAIVLCLLLLGAEFIRRPAKTVPVPRVEGASAKLSLDSIAQQIRNELAEVSGVMGVVPKLRVRGKDVQIVLDLVLAPGTDIHQKVAEVTRLVRETAEQNMGVKVRNVNVDVRLGKGTGVARRVDLTSANQSDAGATVELPPLPGEASAPPAASRGAASGTGAA